MVSLQPSTNEPKDVLKHVYYCLGKDAIPYQDLVFFMAFDLKLYPPSSCEKMLAAGKKEELVDITADKMVKFNTRTLLQKQQQPGSVASVQDIVNDLAADHDLITKAFAIKQDRVLACDVDAKTGNLIARFTGDVAGKVVTVNVDATKKQFHQDLDDDVAAHVTKRVLLKYAIKTLLVKKEDPLAMQLFRDVHANVKSWKFTYKTV
jgi:hypothetical protein